MHVFLEKLTKRSFLIFLVMVAVFLLSWLLPFGELPSDSKVSGSFRESMLLLQDYAQHHVLLCLVPALFIAGAISVFVSQASVMKYFGPKANRVLAYSVASVSGSILAACSCTILPLFAGIYTRGAGLGPASAFLYAGPAINILAIIMTARVLGVQLGVARAVGAIVFSIVIGLLMQLIFRKEEAAKATQAGFYVPEEDDVRPLWKTALYFGAMIAFLVFANWTKVSDTGFAASVYAIKWYLAGASLLLVFVIVALWLRRTEISDWFGSTWTFAKQILPLLFAGVVVAGFLLGRPNHPALIPEQWIADCVGGNGIGANLFASVAGALMYFATLTEVPILEGLRGSGMGDGPSLALLLAGPALSLPNMLVIRSVLGTKKTIVYVLLVVILSAGAGIFYGSIVGGTS